jgi:hypothetical protein
LKSAIHTSAFRQNPLTQPMPSKTNSQHLNFANQGAENEHCHA